jgi:hypothetical protein
VPSPSTRESRFLSAAVSGGSMLKEMAPWSAH